MAQALNFIVDGRFFFNIGVRMRDICLRLIVIVIGNEILHRVVREKLLEFRAQLCCQGLIMSQHQRGALYLLNDFRHGIGLAAAGHTQQHLLINPVIQTVYQGLYGLRLVA